MIPSVLGREGTHMWETEALRGKRKQLGQIKTKEETTTNNKNKNL